MYFCKQNPAYEMRISDWSSDVCSSDLLLVLFPVDRGRDRLRVGELEAVDRADDLGEVAHGARRLGEDQPHLLVGTDHEHQPVGDGGIGPGVDHYVSAEERRGGTEWVGECVFRGSQLPRKKILT